MKGIKGAKGRSVKGTERKGKDGESLVDEEDNMGSSFLQYW